MRQTELRSEQAYESSTVETVGWRLTLGVLTNGPINGPEAEFETIRDRTPRKALIAKREHFQRIDLLSRTADSLAFGPGIPKPGFDTFLDQRTFKFCHGADYLKHKSPGWRAQMEIVAQTDKCDSISAQVGKRVDQMFEASPETIDFPNEHSVKPAPLRISHEAVEGWADSLDPETPWSMYSS